MEQFVCLSGLPRSGSTLLSAILCQNPLIHAEGNSAVCQLMWDLQKSCLTTANEQLKANNRDIDTTHNLISNIPRLYYNNLEHQKIVIDKCRSWTIPANINMLEKYIDKNYKIIVLERSVEDIVKSFCKLYKQNGKSIGNTLLIPNSEPIMRSISGINWAKKNNINNHFLFIRYEDLISNPENVINRIYEFLNLQPFTHDFKNVVCKYPENDEVYGLNGMHQIRNEVKVKENDIKLDKNLLKNCIKIDKLMGYK